MTLSHNVRNRFKALLKSKRHLANKKLESCG